MRALVAIEYVAFDWPSMQDGRPDPQLLVIRESAHVSQSQFAKLIGVNLRTLQNWEQHRTRPTGPARALLKIVASNPKAIEALHT